MKTEVKKKYEIRNNKSDKKKENASQYLCSTLLGNPMQKPGFAILFTTLLLLSNSVMLPSYALTWGFHKKASSKVAQKADSESPPVMDENTVVQALAAGADKPKLAANTAPAKTKSKNSKASKTLVFVAAVGIATAISVPVIISIVYGNKKIQSNRNKSNYNMTAVANSVRLNQMRSLAPTAKPNYDGFLGTAKPLVF